MNRIGALGLPEQVYGGDGSREPRHYKLVSWHWPSSITWRWAIYIRLSRRVSFACGAWRKEYGRAFVAVPFLWLEFSWQPNVWRTKPEFMEECETCFGTGEDRRVHGEWLSCDDCDGTGKAMP